MRTNGYLQYLIHTAGGFDDDGDPIKGSDSWSDHVPCFIKTVTNTSQGLYEDGKFNQYTYQVLVEAYRFPTGINRVKLVRNDMELGEFAVHGKPTPTTMDRVIISV